MTDDDRLDHERYEQWDAAYLLGALSPAERREFEEHLAGCDRCAATLADLAAMPGLLGALPADAALAQLDEQPAPVGRPSDELLPRLLARLRRRRRTRGWVLAGVGALAAAAVVLAVVLPSVLAPDRPTTSLALAPTATVPLDARVDLTSVPWGTRVTMSCSYEATNGTGYSRRYALYVIDREGDELAVSTWNASPGQSVHTTGSMATPVADVERVELRDTLTQKVLLSRAVG